jgi:hypothetical protein
VPGLKGLSLVAAVGGQSLNQVIHAIQVMQLLSLTQEPYGAIWLKLYELSLVADGGV